MNLPSLRNNTVLNEISSLDPITDHARIVHLIAGREFSWDMIRALEVALMRTFCSPGISRLLQKTGQFEKAGQKRYDDTALLIAEFLQWGYDSPRGRQAIEQMNKIHANFKIPNEDYVYVLTTFVLEPVKWVNTYGWRRFTQKEELALFYFFRQVGICMGLQNIPQTLEAFTQFAKEYENRYFVYDPANKKTADATIRIVEGWLPSPLRPFVFSVMTSLLDDAMLGSFGYKNPSTLLCKLVRAGLKSRALFLRYIRLNKKASFFTTIPNRTYPDGYQIERIGPDYFLKRINSKHEPYK